LGDTFEATRIEFERFIDAGDHVVVIGSLQGSGRGSGIRVERRQGYVWTIREGRAVRFQWFNDPRLALEAAGLQE
jgi:ketosteroid isomerase-like protein